MTDEVARGTRSRRKMATSQPKPEDTESACEWMVIMMEMAIVMHVFIGWIANQYSDRNLLSVAAPSKWKKGKEALRQFLAELTPLSRGITVDSGAADSEFPATWVRWSLVRPSPGSMANMFYVAASGTRLANMGQCMLKIICIDGTKAQLQFQVADINKPLASVSHLTDCGYCVVFNKINGRDVSY